VTILIEGLPVAYLELTLIAWTMFAVGVLINSLLTHIGLVELKKLNLRSPLISSIAIWFILFGLAFMFADVPFSYVIITLFCGLCLEIVNAWIISTERNRASSIRQLLKKLPLKDRLLGEYPDDLLMGKLPPPVPPKIPFLASMGIGFIFMSGITDLIFAAVALFVPSPTLEISPGFNVTLNNRLFSGDPVLMAVCGILLLFGSLLVYRKFYVVGGLIGIVFGAWSMFSWFFGFGFGLMSIVGGALAFAQGSRHVTVKEKRWKVEMKC
jgi:hypothetical protein